MKRLALALGLVSSSLAVAQDTPAYLSFRMMATATNPFEYYLDSRIGAPAGFSITASRPAIEKAWDTWNGVTCAAPKGRSLGFTGANVPNPQDRYDAFNVTPAWISSAADPDAKLLDDGFTLALALPTSYSGVLQTCDIYLNAIIYRYSVAETTPPDEVDVESVILHEIGHCMGLDHYGFTAVMSGRITKGAQRRELTELDVQGLCERNPAVGKVGAECFGDGGCDTNLKCLSRSGNVGPPRYCANGCTPNTTPCPLPMDCQPTTAFEPTNQNACQYPSAGVTQVGRACTMSQDCGGALSACIQPAMLPSGTPIWNGGYCSQACEPGQPPCPGGSVCLPSAQNMRLCIASCRVGLADCRGAYTCDPLNSASTGNAGVCVPECRTDMDCIDPVVNGQVVEFDCRLCDGRCVPRQTPGVSIGAPCMQDGQCGAGQICRQADRRFPGKQCTLSCARGCATCPSGSTCVPDDRGELFCMRTCSAPRTCGAGLRCADAPGQKVCVPACQTNLECPVGQACVDGECELPIDPLDAGCRTFCSGVDAGRPVMIVPDAGMGLTPGPVPCACSTSGPFGPMLGLMMLAVFEGWRRRSAQRRRA